MEQNTVILDSAFRILFVENFTHDQRAHIFTMSLNS